MKSNRLSVNIKKTYYIILKSKQKRIKTNLLLSYDNNPLKQEQTKFLGVHIDENRSWIPHINHVYLKISKSIRIIYRSRLLLFVCKIQVSFIFHPRLPLS